MTPPSWHEASEDEKLALVAQVVDGALTVKQACSRFSVSPNSIREWTQVYRRSALQAFDDRIARTLTGQGVSIEGLQSAEFTGSLEDISLPDLLQTIQMGSKDGVISVAHGDGVSRIWCKTGEVIDAESGRLAGENAVFRILSLTQGRVLAHFRTVPRVRTIQSSVQSLLMESARRNDEIARLKVRLGDFGTVHAVSEEAGPSEDARPPHVATVMRLLDGQRTLSQVFAASQIGDLETCQAIADLRDSGRLVEIGRREEPCHSPPSSSSLFATTADVLATGSPSAGSGPSAVAPTVRPSAQRRRFWVRTAVVCSVVGIVSWQCRNEMASDQASRAAHAAPPAVEAGATEPSRPAPRPSGETVVARQEDVPARAEDTSNAPEHVNTEDRPAPTTKPEPVSDPKVVPRRSPRAPAPSRPRRGRRPERVRSKNQPRVDGARATTRVAAGGAESSTPAAPLPPPRAPELLIIEDESPRIQVVE